MTLTLAARSEGRVDVLGRVVLTQALGALDAAEHVVVLDVSRLAPGAYVVRVVMPMGVVMRRFTRAD